MRFVREAQAAARLKSEHVARVTDVGTLETGAPYMVMELLEGADLNALLETRGRFEPELAVDLVLQACEALSEAHAAGIVHRDIKPSNLFVTTAHERSVVKVLDFGISKTVSTDVKLTQTQSMLGTPAYMSPEQMRSAHDVDPRTDVWSLGSVLYELVEGARPFQAENFAELVVKVSMDPPIAPVAMTAELATVVMRCLEKSPSARYGTMVELAAALVPFAADRDHALKLLDRMDRRAPGRTPVSMAIARSGPAAAAATVLDRPRRKLWLVIALAGAVTVAGGIAFAVVSSSSPEPPSVAPSIEVHATAPPPALPPPPQPVVAPADAAGAQPAGVIEPPVSAPHKKKQPKRVQPAAAPPVPAVPATTPKPPCDPYDIRGGC